MGLAEISQEVPIHKQPGPDVQPFAIMRKQWQNLLWFLQDWYMTEGQATVRFKPYQYVLSREAITHRQFSITYQGTIMQYLFKNSLIDECISWLKVNKDL